MLIYSQHFNVKGDTINDNYVDEFRDNGLFYKYTTVNGLTFAHMGLTFLFLI